jgi:CelD/BcsL family acetyltransferase involved in cellulose biosynthesis
MPVYEIDPLQDPRWPELLERDERSTVFHTREWLEALKRTYGYTPIVLTTSSQNQELRNGIPFCIVDSWLTGRRLVSLPFSDHCEPLTTPADFQEIAQFLTAQIKEKRWKYAELRPFSSIEQGEIDFGKCEEYYFHKLDLSPTPEQLLKSFHQDSVRRKIRRAEREGLIYEAGRSREMLAKFYSVFVMTRRRHGLPPPPFKWLCNLIDCLGENIEVRLTSKGDRTTAGMITIKNKRSIVYKYGGSDARFSNLGGTAMLFWRTILDAKSLGLTELDLGRCDTENQGLVTYKDRWGSAKSSLSYWRMPSTPTFPNGWKLRAAKRVFASLPDPVRIRIGDVIYPHIG